MSFTSHPRRLVAIAAVGACATAGAALLADPGRAQQSGTTYTITTVKTRGSVWIAAGGKTMRVGRLNP